MPEIPTSHHSSHQTGCISALVVSAKGEYFLVKPLAPEKQTFTNKNKTKQKNIYLIVSSFPLNCWNLLWRFLICSNETEEKRTIKYVSDTPIIAPHPYAFYKGMSNMQLPDIKQMIIFKNMQRPFSWLPHLTSWIMIQFIFSELIGCSFTISLMAKQTAFAPCAIVFLCHYKAFLESLTHSVDCEGHTFKRFQWHNLALSVSVNTCIYFALLFFHTGCLLNVSGSNSSWIWTKIYRRSPAGPWVTGCCVTVAVYVHSDQLHINGPISQEEALGSIFK